MSFRCYTPRIDKPRLAGTVKARTCEKNNVSLGECINKQPPETETNKLISGAYSNNLTDNKIRQIDICLNTADRFHKIVCLTSCSANGRRQRTLKGTQSRRCWRLDVWLENQLQGSSWFFCTLIQWFHASPFMFLHNTLYLHQARDSS